MKNVFKVKAIQRIAGLIALAAIIGCSSGDDTPETFTVTFNANGGSPTPSTQTIEKGTTATEPTGVTKANTVLDGWYKESALTTKWNFATDLVTANIDLYAKWNCLCAKKDHLGIDETCNCGASQPCGCTLQEYGKLGDVIPIYRKGNVTDEQATTIATLVQDIYIDPTCATVLGQLIGKIDAIHVISGSSTNKNGRVLEIGCNASTPDIVTLLVTTAVS